MTNPNVRPDLEALKVPSESFSDDDMLLRRLWKWEAEMSRSARELAAVPDLKDAAHGTSEVARALRDAAVRIAASNTSTPGPDLIAHIERLHQALALVRMSFGWGALSDETKAVIDAALTKGSER